MSRAPFFSLDGLDGTGKSTQCRLLAEWLRTQRFAVTECADPGTTRVGTLIRRLLLDHGQEMVLTCEMFLFMASRAQLTAEVIRPALDGGTCIVCDRYLLANVVYQGHAGGLDPQQLWDVGRLATGGLEPDLTFVLDLPVEVARQRRARPADRVESRGEDYHAAVRAGFLAEARLHADRIRVIAADRPVDAVHEQIRTEVLTFLHRRGQEIPGS